jgi:acid phosphatase family membrane protein YuiD
MRAPRRIPAALVSFCLVEKHTARGSTAAAWRHTVTALLLTEQSPRGYQTQTNIICLIVTVIIIITMVVGRQQTGRILSTHCG